MDRDGESVISAVKSGQMDALQLLLLEGADPNARDEKGRTALMWAATANRTDLTRTLIVFGAEPDRGDPRTGVTALWIAAHLGHSKVVRLLLAHGATHRETAYLLARKQGHTSSASELASSIRPPLEVA